MKSHELANKLGQLIREERRITNEILELINLALKNRSYLELGFSSMFDWLVRGFGFSNASAYRRIEAAKLLQAVPDAAQKLEHGHLNLSTLSRAQTVIRHQEKISGEKISTQKKEEVVKAIQNKTGVEAELTLVSLFPDVAPPVQKERQIILNQNQIRHEMNLSKEASEDLKRAREVLSHRFPNGSDSDIVAFALKYFLDRRDPLRKPIKPRTSLVKKQSSVSVKPSPNASLTSAAEVNKAARRRLIFQRGNASCIFKDPLTGRICGSRHQLEVDHCRPRALGGDDESANLRLLCRQHNLLMAERTFGKSRIDKFRR